MQMRPLGLEAIFVCDVSYRIRDAIWCYVGESSCHCFAVVVLSQVLQLARLLSFRAISCLKAATVKKPRYLDKRLKLLCISPDIASGVRHENSMH